MTLTSQKVLKGLLKLEEEELTNEVIQPLLEKIHPGRVEYTHSPIEAGRDLVSFGKDYLSRPHILCVQVKAIKLSFGAAPFKDVVNAAEVALKMQVTLENGDLAYPSEVWVITSNPFPEQKRRQLFSYLTELSKKGIKIVAGEELADLLIKNQPEIAAWLSKYASKEIINFISELSDHKEGKAFGFKDNKNLEDFYITTTLSPYTVYTDLAINKKFKVFNFSQIFSVPVRQILKPLDITKNDEEILELCKSNVSKLEGRLYFGEFDVKTQVKFNMSVKDIKKKFISTFLFTEPEFKNLKDILLQIKLQKNTIQKFIFNKFSPKLKNYIEQFNKDSLISESDTKFITNDFNTILKDQGLLNTKSISELDLTEETIKLLEETSSQDILIMANRAILDEVFSFGIVKSGDSKSSYVGGEILFDLKKTLESVISEASKIINNCPKELRDDLSNIKTTMNFLLNTEKFLKTIPEDYKEVLINFNQINEINESSLRIQILSPENLLHLDRLLLIEGFPGCGKTTLLRILAIKLLNLGKKVLYLPCFKISPNFADKNLKEIISEFALGASQIPGNKVEDFTLIIDGLDEAPFILSDVILKNIDKFSNIIVSSRIAFYTSIRSKFLHIAVAPFTSEERDEFFRKWLGKDTSFMEKAKELIEKYEDIDINTRIPLIATVAVALIQRGFQPTTRAEIYEDRLDLLLSNWDKIRGIKRLKIDYPVPKKRFLSELAYKIHSDTVRRRGKDDKSIMRGRQIKYEELLDIYENSLGNWGYSIRYEELFDDLVLSGILIEERKKVYSFGHLTFQEHLVGKYICENLSISEIINHFGSDWWKESLNFYASIKGDISDLIKSMMKSSAFLANIRQIQEMIEFAPYTSPGAIDIVKETIRSIKLRK